MNTLSSRRICRSYHAPATAIFQSRTLSQITAQEANSRRSYSSTSRSMQNVPLEPSKYESLAAWAKRLRELIARSRTETKKAEAILQRLEDDQTRQLAMFRESLRPYANREPRPEHFGLPENHSTPDQWSKDWYK